MNKTKSEVLFWFLIAFLCLCVMVGIAGYFFYRQIQKNIHLMTLQGQQEKKEKDVPVVDADIIDANADDGTPPQQFNDLPLPLNMLPLRHKDIYLRDRAVLDDPLYPPLNRGSFKTHDTYRLVGYLVGQEEPDDTWQLFGRKNGNGRSQFYVRPTDRNQDVKIPVSEDDMRETPPGQRLRDIEYLPETVKINNPLFSGGRYQVIEHPQSDFHSLYI